MSRVWGGDSSTLTHTFGLEGIHLQAGRGPRLCTGTMGTILVHTGHLVTHLLKDLPHCGGITTPCAWSQALPGPERSTPNSTWRGTLASCVQQCTQPWPRACPLPYHHGHVLLLHHLPSSCLRTTEATAAACRQERLSRPQQTTRNVTGAAQERLQRADSSENKSLSPAGHGAGS